jgi:uncharacterized protein (TIGR01244 family)
MGAIGNKLLLCSMNVGTHGARAPIRSKAQGVDFNARRKAPILTRLVRMALDARPISAALAVSPQITGADFAAIKAAGFRAIVNHRPDGEEEGQLSAAEGAQRAAAVGLAYLYQPIVNADFSLPRARMVAAAFAQALVDLPGPVLAHCRSGTRSAILWAMAAQFAQTHDIDFILQKTSEIGYNISNYLPVLRDLRQG